MQITNRGKKWEWLNSLWVLWSFTLILSCVGFFWIGGRVGQRKWIISGLIYLLTNFGLIFVSQGFEQTNTIIFYTANIIVYTGWLAAIVHSFLSRKEYLVRREAVLELKNATRDAYRNELRKDYLGDGGSQVPNIPRLQKETPPPTMMPNTPSEEPIIKIDLNTCSEQQLASLPGVGVALAKRAIDMRTQNGGFSSVEDFNQKLALMPHFAVQMENLAFTTPLPPQPSPTANTGRVIDF